MPAFLGWSPNTSKQVFITFVVIACASFLAPPAQAGLGRVVALGDSFATGTGLGTQLAGSPPSCDRTDGGFPEVAMRKATHGELINRTCNGATTQALFYGSGSIPEQTSVLDGSERAVILSIGENNAQFGAVTEKCLAHVTQFNQDVCTSTYGSGAANLLPGIATAGITTTEGFAPSVGSTLDQIHAKSPDAEIFLIGYLRIAPPDGVTCNTRFDSTYPRSYLNLTPTDAPVFAAWEDTVNTALAGEAAGRSHVHFVDMQPASIAHNACGPAEQRWVNPFQVITPDAVDGENLHPSGAGAEAVSSALINSMVEAGLNLGPEIAISAPADGSHTTAANATLSYSATSSLGTPECTPASGSSLSLSAGLNTFTVTCSDPSGNAASAKTTISRGSVPAVAITAPGATTTHTTANSLNVAFSVDGSTSIPAGTTCTVDGVTSSSTQSNQVSLDLGGNTITVSCVNPYGGGSATFAIDRGVIPQVAIVAPNSGSWTASSVVNVSFTVSGNSVIPSGTTCAVNDTATTSSTVNSVALTDGPNAIEVACSNPFGESSASVSITQGDGPAVAITSPANGLSTTSSSILVAFTINGTATIPLDTTCKVGASDTTSAGANLVNLGLGANSITVSCTNAVGSDQQTVVVTREPVAAATPTPPISGGVPSALEVSISSVSPRHFSPLKKGSPFSRTPLKRGARVRVTLNVATGIRVRIEQLGGRQIRSGWTDFDLPAGVSILQLSGRALKHALPVGRYRIRLAVSGTSTSHVGRSFRIVR